MDYNEKDAIAYIRKQLPENSTVNIDDDEFLNVIDMIFDYYEDSGFLDISAENDDMELDVDALVAYVKKMVAKDRHSPFKPDDVPAIVKAELEYEDSIEDVE